MKKTKYLHIGIIIAGIIFNCIGIFHPNLWFDEAYSVGLASKSFSDIWIIGGNDVHPVLYYWLLHIVYLITQCFGASLNTTIIGYRIFSTTCISILGILGFTHIRKDFGEKVGVLFSFFSYFLPMVCIYSSEVRMYSLAVVLVTILAIYAYRLYKNQNSVKNWAIFGLSSLACIYVHYYGLMSAGIINCVLLFNFIKRKNTKSIITILTLGITQLVCYIPWIMCFLNQLKHVSKGFWISLEFPKTLYQVIGTQFSGKLEDIVGFIAVVLLYAYFAIKIYVNRKNINNAQNSEISENEKNCIPRNNGICNICFSNFGSIVYECNTKNTNFIL